MYRTYSLDPKYTKNVQNVAYYFYFLNAVTDFSILSY